MYFDEETELCYVRHRYYSCDTGTFNSQDPIGLKGGMQLYAYVHDVNSFVDTMGLSSNPITFTSSSGQLIKSASAKGSLSRLIILT